MSQDCGCTNTTNNCNCNNTCCEQDACQEEVCGCKIELDSACVEIKVDFECIGQLNCKRRFKPVNGNLIKVGHHT